MSDVEVIEIDLVEHNTQARKMNELIGLLGRLEQFKNINSTAPLQLDESDNETQNFNQMNRVEVHDGKNSSGGPQKSRNNYRQRNSNAQMRSKNFSTPPNRSSYPPWSSGVRESPQRIQEMDDIPPWISDMNEAPARSFRMNEAPLGDFPMNEASTRRFSMNEAPSRNFALNDTPSNIFEMNEAPSRNFASNEAPRRNFAMNSAHRRNFPMNEAPPRNIPMNKAPRNFPMNKEPSRNFAINEAQPRGFGMGERPPRNFATIGAPPRNFATIGAPPRNLPTPEAPVLRSRFPMNEVPSPPALFPSVARSTPVAPRLDVLPVPSSQPASKTWGDARKSQLLKRAAWYDVEGVHALDSCGDPVPPGRKVLSAVHSGRVDVIPRLKLAESWYQCALHGAGRSFHSRGPFPELIPPIIPQDGLDVFMADNPADFKFYEPSLPSMSELQINAADKPLFDPRSVENWESRPATLKLNEKLAAQMREIAAIQAVAVDCLKNQMKNLEDSIKSFQQIPKTGYMQQKAHAKALDELDGLQLTLEDLDVMTTMVCNRALVFFNTTSVASRKYFLDSCSVPPASHRALLHDKHTKSLFTDASKWVSMSESLSLVPQSMMIPLHHVGVKLTNGTITDQIVEPRMRATTKISPLPFVAKTDGEKLSVGQSSGERGTKTTLKSALKPQAHAESERQSEVRSRNQPSTQEKPERCLIASDASSRKNVSGPEGWDFPGSRNLPSRGNANNSKTQDVESDVLAQSTGLSVEDVSFLRSVFNVKDAGEKSPTKRKNNEESSEDVLYYRDISPIASTSKDDRPRNDDYRRKDDMYLNKNRGNNDGDSHKRDVSSSRKKSTVGDTRNSERNVGTHGQSMTRIGNRGMSGSSDSPTKAASKHELFKNPDNPAVTQRNDVLAKVLQHSPPRRNKSPSGARKSPSRGREKSPFDDFESTIRRTYGNRGTATRKEVEYDRSRRSSPPAKQKSQQNRYDRDEDSPEEVCRIILPGRKDGSNNSTRKRSRSPYSNPSQPKSRRSRSPSPRRTSENSNNEELSKLFGLMGSMIQSVREKMKEPVPNDLSKQMAFLLSSMQDNR
ncbi:unnamed protein product [Notodromas monacha]|uniref:Uncharacterized protein n=1 Tax=Notodromas monacha TaxID=399045 RepID=A0A7R9BJJ5_9CRUS|nr:unnamed protein product [Notodromas monacha]CAG0915543.1 unnamed protein product [Notodromas monacha]